MLLPMPGGDYVRPVTETAEQALDTLVGRCLRLLDRCEQYERTGVELIEIADVRAYLQGTA